ncbi:MAG: hypothetical protein ACI9AX_001959, partial [Polaromonas sp.]
MLTPKTPIEMWLSGVSLWRASVEMQIELASKVLRFTGAYPAVAVPAKAATTLHGETGKPVAVKSATVTQLKPATKAALKPAAKVKAPAKPAAPKAVVAKPVAPKAVAAKPVAPKAVVAKPAAPKA